MTVTADEQKRVVLPSAKPGEQFDLHLAASGSMVLTPLAAAHPHPAKVKIEKQGRYTVGVLDRAIDEVALEEALAEFP